MALLIITYDSRHLCRSMLDELIRSSPVSRTPLTHSSKSPVQSVITGTRSMLPPLALGVLCVRVWRAVWGSQLATRLSEMPAHACVAVECVFECGSLGTLVKWPAQAAWCDQRATLASRWPPPRRWQGCARRAYLPVCVVFVFVFLGYLYAKTLSAGSPPTPDSRLSD